METVVSRKRSWSIFCKLLRRKDVSEADKKPSQVISISPFFAMPSPALREILQAVADGKLSVDQAVSRADIDLMASIPGATIDLGRAARCRFGEVIYGEGKPASLIIAITEKQLAAGQDVLVTRVEPTAAAALCQHFAHHRHHTDARTVRIANGPIALQPRVLPCPALPHALTNGTGSVQGGEIHVAVVTAGSTDHAVAAEAIETLDWMGVPVDEMTDIGVAGPQRLLAVVPRLRTASVVVIIAGMEGALASVVGGHVACPVIAVPTSVGYGSAFAGLTPLLGMLTSCAANVTVVGIDAGFKGGYVAGLIATGLRDLAASLSSATSIS